MIDNCIWIGLYLYIVRVKNTILCWKTKEHLQEKKEKLSPTLSRVTLTHLEIYSPLFFYNVKYVPDKNHEWFGKGGFTVYGKRDLLWKSVSFQCYRINIDPAIKISTEVEDFCCRVTKCRYRSNRVGERRHVNQSRESQRETSKQLRTLLMRIFV